MTDVPKFVGRVEDLDTLHKLVTENRIEEHDSLALLTSIHGFGGIGKTTLARMYAWKYKNYFDGNVIWIDSEKFDSMQIAFQKVAEKLNLNVKKPANLDLSDLTGSVYNVFADTKCLFIFDNAEEFSGPNGVQQFLPSGIIRKPYLLLTSRRRDCFPTERVLPLDVLSESDSIELVKKYIPDATYEIADKLAERLDRVPLAINQAIAYITKLLPLQRKSSVDDVLISINKFLKEYECNSKRILKSEFKGAGGYGKNIFSICEMSLQKMGHEEGGKLAKHMMRYISFLHPDDIQLEFLLNLPYQIEGRLGKLQRIIEWKPEKAMDPNITAHLLRSYSLININTTDKTIKVHRLVQDAMIFLLSEVKELCYVKRLITALDEQVYSVSLLHCISIKRSCRFPAIITYIENVVPNGVIELMGFLNGVNIDLSRELEKLANNPGPHLMTRILKSMTCNDMNESAKNYLKTYFKIESEPGSLLLTNYVVFATFIIPERQKSVLQSFFECFSILHIKECKRAIMPGLLGTNFSSEDVNIFLDIMNRSAISYRSSEKCHIDYLYDVYLFNDYLQIPESLANEFPCLNYLKSSSSFTSIDELEAFNLSWDFKNSIVWSLLNYFEFNLAAVRSATSFICFLGCTVAEYIENYKATFDAVVQHHKNVEIIVQCTNAKLLKDCNYKYYALLALICCLPTEFSVPYKIKHIFYRLDYTQLQFRWDNLQKLKNLRFLAQGSEDIYFMNSDLQVELRKNVLTLQDKTNAVKHIHSACVASMNRNLYKDMLKYWCNLMNQEDLREISLNCNLSSPGL